MCTKEEVRAEVRVAADEIERVVMSKVETCRAEVDEVIYKSYNATAKVASENGKQIAEVKEHLKRLDSRFSAHDIQEKEYQRRIDAHLEAQAPLTMLTKDDIQALKDVAQGYAGMSVMRKFILGVAGIVLALGAIVGGFIGLIRAIK